MIRIGVEVGAKTLTLVWARRRGQQWVWSHREEIRQPGDESRALREALARLLQPLRRYRIGAQLAVAAPESTLRVLTMRVLRLTDIPGALHARLPELLPIDASRAQVQSALQHQRSVDGQVECTVAVAACDREALQGVLDVLWQAGWAPNAVVPRALALANSARALGRVGAEPLLLIDIGERLTTMAILHGGAVVYARDIALGLQHVIEALTAQVAVGSTTVSLSWDHASAMLMTQGILDATAASVPCVAGQLPVATYLAMIQPVLEQLIHEFRRTVAFGEEAGDAVASGRAFMSGLGAAVPHMVPWCAKQLGLPVDRLDCSTLVPQADTRATVACGLALLPERQPLDLRPAGVVRRRRVVRAFALTACGLWLVALGVWCAAGIQSLRSQALARQQSAWEQRWILVQPLTALQQQVTAYAQASQPLLARPAVSSAWLRQLATNFPVPVRLTKCSIDRTKVVQLAGEARGDGQNPEAAVSMLTLWLEQAEVCTNVQLDSSRRVGTSGDLVEFSLHCQAR